METKRHTFISKRICIGVAWLATIWSLIYAFNRQEFFEPFIVIVLLALVAVSFFVAFVIIAFVFKKVRAKLTKPIKFIGRLIIYTAIFLFISLPLSAVFISKIETNIANSIIATIEANTYLGIDELCSEKIVVILNTKFPKLEFKLEKNDDNCMVYYTEIFGLTFVEHDFRIETDASGTKVTYSKWED
jgi:hypothetical protein